MINPRPQSPTLPQRLGASDRNRRSTDVGPPQLRALAASRPLIGDNVLSALRPALGWRGRHASRTFLALRRLRPLSTLHVVEDLVERVLGTSPLPRRDNEVMLLLAALRQHLPLLERIVAEADPDLARQARRIRKAPLPEGYMQQVILTIRLAEVAQALIDAVPANAGAVLDAAGHPPAPGPDLTTVRETARADALQHGAVPTAELASAATGSPGGCGPPM